MEKLKIIWFHIIVFLSLIGVTSQIASAEQTKKPFTVVDEIGVTYFGGPEGFPLDTFLGEGAVVFSPDRNYFAVHTVRGHLDLNQLEDSLRFYRTQDLEKFLQDSDEQPPSPVWAVTRHGKKGPSINGWRWLDDSSGIAFLETGAGNQRLVLADLRNKTIEQLSTATETVFLFDVRDRRHYVYTVADPAPSQNRRDEHQTAVIVGTGRPLDELIFPNEIASPPRHLWAVVGGSRFEVKHDGDPLVPEETGGRLCMALSPDGGSVVTQLPLKAPSSWETLYAPPYGSSPYRVRAGEPASQYVRIDLRNGLIRALTDAPTGSAGGWWRVGACPSWSSDGKGVLLPNSFLKSADDIPSLPCVAVVDLSSNAGTCVETLEGANEAGRSKGSYFVQSARFADGDKQRVIVIGRNFNDSLYRSTEYRRTVGGTWAVTEQIKGMPNVAHDGLEVSVRQSFQEPPLLVASNKKTSRVIWDPNPQLKKIELGGASVYTWKDKEGRDWRGGLYLPSDYKSGQRYPLVIQTHGFNEAEFQPAGGYPTAFAARALAANGIVVLQIGETSRCDVGPDEGPCAVSSYEAAVNKLVSDGLADPGKLGIIGFSRTCFYVMEMLTMSSLHTKAASITDGQMATYLQYMEAVGESDVPRQFDSVIGAPPFGAGLELWLKRSPGFNLDKITTPLSVNTVLGSPSLLGMWEPYAALYYLHKPVDLIMIRGDEHVLTNPAIRLASQGGSVDWFRFWLQDYEDPDPAKAEQYTRWRELRKMQAKNEKKVITPESGSN